MCKDNTFLSFICHSYHESLLYDSGYRKNKNLLPCLYLQMTTSSLLCKDSIRLFQIVAHRKNNFHKKPKYSRFFFVKSTT